MWLANKIRELEQRIEKLEVQDAVNALDSITKQARKIADEMFEIVSEMPKPHYTRGQEIEVYYKGDYANWWQKALYLEKLKEDVHLVFIKDWCKLGQFPDAHIRPLQQSEKPAFTRGQEVEVTSDDKHWLKAMYLYNDGENLAPHNVWLIDANEINYYDEEQIRPLQTTEG